MNGNRYQKKRKGREGNRTYRKNKKSLERSWSNIKKSTVII